MCVFLKFVFIEFTSEQITGESFFIHWQLDKLDVTCGVVT